MIAGENGYFSLIRVQWQQKEGRSTCPCVFVTWKTLGALTREARAEESVAEKMPAVMRGPNPDTMLMTLRREVQVRRLIQQRVKKKKKFKPKFYADASLSTFCDLESL